MDKNISFIDNIKRNIFNLLQQMNNIESNNRFKNYNRIKRI